MKFFNIRLDLSQNEFDVLTNCIDFNKLEEEVKKSTNLEIENDLLEKINNPKKIKYSFKKNSASEKATKVRSEKAKEKMKVAIEILQTQKKKITPYTISQICGVSFVTVKKYYDKDTLISLNEIKE